MDAISLKEAVIRALSTFPDLPPVYCSRYKIFLFTSSGVFCGKISKSTILESETGKILFNPAFTMKEIVDYLIDCGFSVFEKGLEENPDSPHRTKGGFIVLEDVSLLSNDMKIKIQKIESLVVFIDQIAAVSLGIVE